ncbi:phage recombination protein Bet [Aggregatibacter actinomycetemcomitans]|uniref:phage recombination protein Bet n=1 Tax=Aggregatibacter actinomycetemcomitans TaxID=714 RepID=UPI001E55B6C7|nr:phage recombination protein Bet [Aggregatibacter actinomycetemcomitans]
MATALQTLTAKLAERFDMGNSDGLINVLTTTAFRGQEVSQAQMTALLVVANQYGLNPWTNELYAFPHNGAIVPILGVDGWSRIMNEHPQHDGVDFSFNEDGSSCTCTIYRKDRKHPIVVTEYLNECQRNSPAWKSHPKRMLRHKAMIQCARLAFGFTGIYDQDEAERIVENDKDPINVTPNQAAIEAHAVELITPEQLEQMRGLIEVTQSNVEGVLAAAGNVSSLEKISKNNADRVIAKLLDKLNRQQSQDDDYGEDVPL